MIQLYGQIIFSIVTVFYFHIWFRPVLIKDHKNLSFYQQVNVMLKLYFFNLIISKCFKSSEIYLKFDISKAFYLVYLLLLRFSLFLHFYFYNFISPITIPHFLARIFFLPFSGSLPFVISLSLHSLVLFYWFPKKSDGFQFLFFLHIFKIPR